MPKTVFPKDWLLYLKDFDRVTLRLSTPLNDLLDLEKRVPSCYRKKTIITKEKKRELFIPNSELKKSQRKILKQILNFRFPDYTHGGIPNRSIITNAEKHLSQKWVMCLDIQDFFPSVHFKRIYNNFLSLNCSPRIAELLTHFTTYEYQLPQGTPTSPAVANMVLYNLDRRLFKLCKIKEFKYSRYFDDITISGLHNPKSLIKKCELIINQEGFKINKSSEKLRIMPSTQEQLVTGLLVNGGKLHISHKERKGIHDILDKLISGDFSIFIDREPIKVKRVLEGHLAFLKSVDPVMAKTLRQKFNRINWNSFCS